jgi:hypothetical protein
MDLGWSKVVEDHTEAIQLPQFLMPEEMDTRNQLQLVTLDSRPEFQGRSSDIE